MHDEIQKEFIGLGQKKSQVEGELERLERLKELIKTEIHELKEEFEQSEHIVENLRETHLSKFKSKLDTFMAEFTKIKAENEPIAMSYLNKVKDLIEEGEEHIKDMESKIPKDLKSVKKDVREKYYKLKFMMKEYSRDHKSASANYEKLKQYFSSFDEKQFRKMEKGTDQFAEFRKLKDEKAILELLVRKMRDEIQVTRIDFQNRKKRLEKIQHLSVSKKLDLLQYYNEINILCSKMNRAKMVGGDISENLKKLQEISQGQDDLMIAISNDLLSKCHTSTNIITSKAILKFFKENREKYYWDCFQRKESLLNISGRSMYYMYKYLLLDRVKFEKKYAIPHVLKDDSTV